MDELAVALKLDPLELRLRCYSDRDHHNDIPFTSKKLRECYRQGAEAFGWHKRNPEPRSMRDGTELVGWGMASGVWEALQMPAAARIVLTANGHAEVACSFSDIGTGTYTIAAQVAATSCFGTEGPMTSPREVKPVAEPPSVIWYHSSPCLSTPSTPICPTW
jgi:xanthine dehydrogenase YagR molybdenum-binding subunit